MNKKTRKIQLRILILTEGEKTEINYFNSFKRSEKYRRNLSGIDIKIYKPKDHSPLGLVKEAIGKAKIKNKDDKYDIIWIVFDKDGHEGIPNTFEEVKQHNQDNPNNKINIGFSSICIEYWILLHFEKTSKPFQKCNEVINHIKKEKYITDYDKGKFKYETLVEKEKIDKAVENAKWLANQQESELKSNRIYEMNPITTVHKLVKMLVRLGEGNDFDSEESETKYEYPIDPLI